MESSQISANKLNIGKVVLNTATCLVISFGLYFVVTLGAGLLFGYSIVIAWGAVIAALIATTLVVYAINKNTPIERLVGFKIAGWILIAVGVAGLLLNLLVFRKPILGDIAYAVMGIINIGMGKGRD